MGGTKQEAKKPKKKAADEDSALSMGEEANGEFEDAHQGMYNDDSDEQVVEDVQLNDDDAPVEEETTIFDEEGKMKAKEKEALMSKQLDTQTIKKNLDMKQKKT